MDFVFGWCAGGCENVGVILVVGGISMVCISHCVLLDVCVSFEKDLLLV